MDLAFLRRAERMLAREAVPAIDHGVLVAALAAHQAASATARAAASRRLRASGWAHRHEALVELLVAGPGWRDAARAQRGSFDPRAAAAAVNRT